MSGPFRLGEVVLGQNFVDFTEHNGEELLVVGGLEYRTVTCLTSLKTVSGMSYKVQTKYGETFTCGPHQLRRRKPPTTGEESVLALFSGQPQAVPA